MANPTPIRNSSKRPLSPSASSPPRNRTHFAPYSDIRFSNTPKSAPIDAPAARAQMLALESDQKDTLLKTLFDLHPTARTSIVATLPSINSIPSPANIITKSAYFGEHVIRCHRELLGDNWRLDLEKPERGICQRAASVLEPTIEFIIIDLEGLLGEGAGQWMDCDHTHAMYRMDAAIALLEIALIMFERQRRSVIYARLPEHENFLPTGRAELKCMAKACFDRLADAWETWTTPERQYPCSYELYERDLMDNHDMEHSGNWLLEWKDWQVAAQYTIGGDTRMADRYALSDNQPHPLRKALWRYIDFPPILQKISDIPPILPCSGHNGNLAVDHWLGTSFDEVGRIIRDAQLQERKPQVASLEGILI